MVNFLIFITRHEGTWWWRVCRTDPAIPDAGTVSFRRRRANTPLVNKATLPRESNRAQNRSTPSWWSDSSRESRCNTGDRLSRKPYVPPSYPCNGRWENCRCPADSRFYYQEFFLVNFHRLFTLCKRSVSLDGILLLSMINAIYDIKILTWNDD